jgi:hypothetical protein
MRYGSESRRGRPNGRHHSQADIQLLEYLAKVSIKYQVDSDKFFSSLTKAYRHRRSECGKLSVECRLREKESAIFLITSGRGVVGQFRISEQLLNVETNLLKEYVLRLSAKRSLVQDAKSQSCKIRDLRAGMKRISIDAQVLEVSQPMQIATSSAFYTNLVNALIGDETGTINLSLLGAQIKAVTLHDIIQIENAHVAWFRGERQLRVGKHGTINVVNSTANNTGMAHSDLKKLQSICMK